MVVSFWVFTVTYFRNTTTTLISPVLVYGEAQTFV